jgi:diguanylate cyclase (GGDEF)-like protein
MTIARVIHSVAASTLLRDRDQLEQAIADLILQFLQARSVTVLHLAEQDGVRKVLKRTSGTATARAASSEPESTCEAVETLISSNEALWRECVAVEGFIESVTPEGEILAVFPLRVRGEVLRVVEVISGESLAVAQLDLVYAVLRIVENHLALLDYGERDTLTSLLNRKTFESQFEKVRCALGEPVGTRTPEPTWLALVDIDHFKSINDTQGHLFGDEVLLLVSQLMKRNFRGADRLFRFGGEEFLIMMDDTSESGVQVALERLRVSIADFSFPQVRQVTISTGYTRVQASDVPTTCVERADEALYYAKNHGRNNVQNYDSLVASGALKQKEEKGDIELF